MSALGPVLAVALGGALGALARYGVGLALLDRWPQGAPVATFGINVVGSFLLALLVFGDFLGLEPRLRLALGVGLLGAFTTFSTYEVEVLGLLERSTPLALLYLLGSPLCGLLAALAGRFVMLQLRG